MREVLKEDREVENLIGLGREFQKWETEGTKELKEEEVREKGTQTLRGSKLRWMSGEEEEGGQIY